MNFRPATWRPTTVFGILLALCLLAYAASIPLPRIDGLLIGSDGIGYYMYVHSLVIDGDLDFHNEYARLGWPTPEPTPTGLLPNHFAIGAGLLWAPFFVAAHLLSLALHALGLQVSVDGYGYLYQGAIAVGSILYGAAALLADVPYGKTLFAAHGVSVHPVALVWHESDLLSDHRAIHVTHGFTLRHRPVCLFG
ncbi:MAG: hypothetical protein IPK16_33585 [Anaerolineales bacterium]|nr:hypothetical protein [Anaerolineales bacterium]